VTELIVPPRLRAAHLECLARITAGEPSEILGRRRIEVSSVRADGTEIPVELAVTQTSEQPRRFTGWLRDLSERRDAQAELARRKTLLERAEQLAEMGSWEWRLETDELLWSDNRFRMCGLEPGEITPTLGYLVEHAHPGDRVRLQRSIARGRETGTMPPLEYRVVLADGQVRHLRARATVVEREHGEPRVIVGTTEDLTERRVAEREIAAHFAVSDALDGWCSLNDSGETLLSRLAEALGCEVAGLWLPNENLVANRIVWCNAPDEMAPFTDATRRIRFPRGVGLVGRAWECGNPLYVTDTLEDKGAFRRRAAAERVGLRCGFAVPARIANDVLAVLDFYAREQMAITDSLTRSLTGIGYELGRFFARRGAELVPTRLTARELEVLQLAAEGHSRPAMAERLVLSTSTVKTHLENIYSKLSVSNRASAVAAGMRLGLIE
jgi:PAS domain S-box-containing protein